jgi:hypothetical protein
MAPDVATTMAAAPDKPIDNTAAILTTDCHLLAIVITALLS